ncbi:MAG: GIY-YIG nuclease family protein [Candidatus Levyibacteriota bacterium]
MFYVYVLKSILNDQIYVGSTKNLKIRFKEHNNGKIISTKRYKPWKLIYYEAYTEEKLARMREKKLKYHGNAMKELKKRIGLINNGLPSTTFQKKAGAGFTLVEILVAITIVSTLIVGAAMTLNPAGQIAKSQDAVRQRDLQQVKLALDLYYNDRNCYPSPSDSPFAAALKDGAEWKEGDTVYMKKVPKDPARVSYVYTTESTACPQWSVVFAKLSKPSTLLTICSLMSQSNCVPKGFDTTWACVTSGNTGCTILASGEIDISGFSSGTGSGAISTPTSAPSAPVSDQDFFVAQPPEANPQFYEGTISPLFQQIGSNQKVTVNVAGAAADVASVSVTVKSDTKTQTYPATMTAGTSADGTWEASWTVDDTTAKRFMITLSGTDSAGISSTFDISIR